jgi:hypothetical protein
LPKEGVQLSWTAFSADDSLRYEAIISRSADMNDMGARVLKIETTDTYYTPDEGLLTDNQTYYWRVIAHVNDNPDGLPSPVWSFKTLGKPEARLPADIDTGFRAPFNFIWQAVNNDGGYRIVISPNQDLSGPMKNSVVSNTQFTIASGDEDLKYGVRYYWRVYALDSSGEQHDAYASTIRKYDLFGVPALTFPEQHGSQPTGGFNFQWQAVSGAVTFHLLVRESGGEYTNPVIDQVVNSTSYAIPRYSLSGGVTYYWKVFAINDNQDEGADSAEFYFTTHDAMRITDINPNPSASPKTADAFPISLGSPELTAFMDHLFFVATNGDEYGLWMTDGTPEGVKRVGEFVYPRYLNIGVNGLFLSLAKAPAIIEIGSG